MHSYFKEGKDRLLACGQQQQKKSLDSEVDLRAAAAAAGRSCEARVCRRAVADFYAQSLEAEVDNATVRRGKKSLSPKVS